MSSKTIVNRFTVRGTDTSYTPSTNVVTPTAITYSPTITISGGLMPNWQRVIRDGLNATTSLSVTVQAVEVKGGYCSANYKTSPGGQIQGNTKSPFLNLVTGYPTASLVSSAEASAIRSIYAQIRGASQQFAGGVFLGEIRQTVKLITRPSSAFLKLASKFSSSSKSKISRMQKKGATSKQVTKAIGNDYLQWTFGAQPLLSDIKSASVALQRILSDPPRRRLQAKGTGQSGPVTTQFGPDVVGAMSWSKKQTIASTSDVKYYGMFVEATRSPTLLAQAGRIASLSGFSLAQFVPTIWNLLPYSFIADYFVNIGDMLEAATTDTSGVKWLSKTTVNTAILDYTITPDQSFAKAFHPTWTFLSFSGAAGGVVLTSRTISRSATTVPILGPRLNIDYNSGKKILNLTALVLSKR